MTGANVVRGEISSSSANDSAPARVSLIGSGLRKRAIPYPKAISLPKAEKLCPKTSSGPATECSKILAADSVYSAKSEDYEYIQPTRRDLNDLDSFDFNTTDVLESRDGMIESRAIGKSVTICRGVKKFNIHIKAWNRGGVFPIWDNEAWDDCNNCKFEALSVAPSLTTANIFPDEMGIQPRTQDVPGGSSGRIQVYAVEHVLEGQLLTDFLAKSSDETTFSDICHDMTASDWFNSQAVPGGMTSTGVAQSPWQYIADGYPYSEGRRAPAYPAHHEDEFVRVITSVNVMKEFAFKFKDRLPGNDDMQGLSASEDTVDRAIRTMKVVIMTYKYLIASDIQSLLYTQANRVGDRMDEMEDMLRDAGRSDIQGMKGIWIRFVKGRTELAGGKLRVFLTSWMPVIERVLEGTDPNQDDDTREELREKIRVLRSEVDNLPRFRNPF